MGKGSVSSGGAESLYMKGAEQLAAAAQVASQYFAENTALANRVIGDQQLAAKQGLQPLTSTATAALGELRSLYGLPPADPLAGIQNIFQAQAQHYESRGDIPVEFRTQFSNLASDFNLIKGEKDAAKRDQMRNDLLSKVDKTISDFSGIVPQVGTSDTYESGYFSSTVNSLKQATQQLQNADLSDEGLSPKALSNEQITEKLRNRPGYQFALGEGQRAIERGAAARGTRLSGGQLIGLAQYGQGMADQQYGAETGRLASLAGLTMPGIQQTSGISSQQAGQQGNNLMQQAQALSNNQMTAGQGYLQAYMGAGQANMQAQMQNAQQQQGLLKTGLGLAGSLLGGLF